MQKSAANLNKRSRGPGQHVKDEFRLGPGEQDSTLGTVIIQFYYDSKKPRYGQSGQKPLPSRSWTQKEQDAAFAEIVAYCTQHQVTPHRRETPRGPVYYVRIYQDPLVWRRIKVKIQRTGLMAEQPIPPLSAIPPQLPLRS